MITSNIQLGFLNYCPVWVGGKINWPGQLAPWGEDNQGGG